MGYGSQEEKMSRTGIYCFAVEAFKGEDHAVLNSLRLWRDEALVSNNLLRKKFVNFYYAHLCHPGGKLLRAVPALKPIARKSILLFAKANGIKTSVL